MGYCLGSFLFPTTVVRMLNVFHKPFAACSFLLSNVMSQGTLQQTYLTTAQIGELHKVIQFAICMLINYRFSPGK